MPKLTPPTPVAGTPTPPTALAGTPTPPTALAGVTPINLDAQPAPVVVVADATENPQAKSHYNNQMEDDHGTRTTVTGADVLTYENLGACLVDLTDTGLTEVPLYINNSYRTIPNGAKLIVNTVDLVNLLRKDYITEIETSKINLTIL